MICRIFSEAAFADGVGRTVYLEVPRGIYQIMTGLRKLEKCAFYTLIPPEKCVKYALNLSKKCVIL